MLKRLAAKLKEQLEVMFTGKRILPQPPVLTDFAWHDDPVSQRTEWTPTRAGGTNFQTHALVQAAPHRLEFRPVRGAIAFAALFLAIGLVALAAGLVLLFFVDQRLLPVLALLFGLVFAGFGGAMLRAGFTPTVFDTSEMMFYRGRTLPRDVVYDTREKNYVALSQIHALQIISEYIGSGSSYLSYELNLVCEDGHRVNVVDHGDPECLREDAQTLAAFLNVPVWDATLAPR